MGFRRRYTRFWSPILGRDMELLHFGDWGYPLLFLPTSEGRFYDLEDRGMIASLSEAIGRGYVQVFCLETLDHETLFAPVSLGERRDRWLALERHWVEEFIPYACHEAQNNFLGVAGCSLGATHAVNLALRHPQLVRRCVALAGPHDLANAHPLFSDCAPQDRERELYFINPIAYMAHMSREKWFALGGGGLDLQLITAHQDICLEDNLRLAGVLSRNHIPHHLAVWEGPHDWPVWRAQIPHFI